MSFAVGLILLLGQTPARPPGFVAPPGVRLEMTLDPIETPPSDRSGAGRPAFVREPGTLNVGLRYVNGGAKPIEIVEGDFWRNHRLTIRDEAGVEPPLTDRGRSERRTFMGVEGGHLPGSSQRTSVAPGDAFTWTLATVPGWHYDLVPGRRYAATIEYREGVGAPLRLVSNPVSFVAPRSRRRRGGVSRSCRPPRPRGCAWSSVPSLRASVAES